MKRALFLVLMALPLSSVSLAAPEIMLCFHRDGQIWIEPFEPSCCKGGCEEEAPSACPDDDCADLPVIETDPFVSPAPDVFENPRVASEFSLPPVLVSGERGRVRRPRSFSGPPPPKPEEHLRTVILRL